MRCPQRAVEVVSSEKTVVDKAEMKLSRDEDAPMCMTLAPDEFNDWDDADDEGEESAKRAEVGASQRKVSSVSSCNLCDHLTHP